MSDVTPKCACECAPQSRPDAIVICMGSSCFARGNRNNLRVIEAFLREHAPNVEILLQGSRCEGHCEQGPNVWINGLLYHGVDKGMLIDALHHHFGGGARESGHES